MRYLDGPKTVKWLAEYLGENWDDKLPATLTRRLREWKQGGRVDIYTLDRWTTAHFGKPVQAIVPEYLRAELPRRRRGKLSKWEKEKARKLFREGERLSDISRAMDISPRTISRLCKDLEDPRHEAWAKRREQAREMYVAGTRTPDIAQTLGVHRSSVQAWCKDLPNHPTGPIRGQSKNYRYGVRRRWRRD